MTPITRYWATTQKGVYSPLLRWEKDLQKLYRKEKVIPKEGFKRDERPWYGIFKEQDEKGRGK